MFKTSENADQNYLATVVKLDSIELHPNADRLEIVEVFGNKIIVAKGQYKIGDVVIYFPVETSINPEFLSWANLFDKAELNADQTTKGFFSPKGCRVKAIKLRDIPSQGFVYPIAKFAEFISAKSLGENPLWETKIGEDFDMIGEFKLLEKYIPKSGGQQVQTKKIKKLDAFEKIVVKLPRKLSKPILSLYRDYVKAHPETLQKRLVDGYFSLHYDTPPLGRNSHLIAPDSMITITPKWHGSSAAYSMPKVLHKFTLWEKCKYLLGAEIPYYDYEFLVASRNRLRAFNPKETPTDIWSVHAKDIKDKLWEGVTVYGEIVGYTPQGKMVQKSYDYGCEPLKSKFMVYRITTKDSDDAEIQEQPWWVIKEFCQLQGLEYVPEYYHGYAKNLFPDLDASDPNWNKEFLKRLEKEYLDKPDEFCKNDVVREGICVRIEDTDAKKAFKFKSPKFLQKESAERDEVDI